MVRELDDVTLTFSLWEQSRRELHELEERLLPAKRAAARLGAAELDALDAQMSLVRGKTDRLLGQALEALRQYAAAGNTGV